MTLTNDTLSGNSAIYSSAAAFTTTARRRQPTTTARSTLNNTIVANSPTGGDVFTIYDTLTGSHNLIVMTAVAGLADTIVCRPQFRPTAEQRRADPDHGPAVRQPGHRRGKRSSRRHRAHDRPARCPPRPGRASTPGPNVDIGAYEASSSYLVTTTADSTDVGTLRAAVGWANVSTNANPANSPRGPQHDRLRHRGRLHHAQTITLPAASSRWSNTISGPGDDRLTLSGGGDDQRWRHLAVSFRSIAGVTDREHLAG